MAASRTGSSSSVRRRQRSIRVSVAIGLTAAATVVVLAALPTRSALWLGAGSALALALSWAALRLMWTEVLQSRRENAADRAAAAAAYVELFTLRAAEHEEFAAEMTERLAEAHLARRELEGLVTQHQGRADRAEATVVSLERTVASLRAGQADDLAAWDEQTTRKTTRKASRAASRTSLKGA